MRPPPASKDSMGAGSGMNREAMIRPAERRGGQCGPAFAQ
jgi:hypothetical protein